MKAFTPYLNFDGNTRDAMTFYQKAFGGDLSIQTFGDVKMGTPEHANRVMHARLANGSAVLMASDSMPEHAFNPGTNVWTTVECDSVEEIDRVFAAMSEGGKVSQPLQDTFWGARFGMLVDKFSTNWMFNCELPKQA